MAVGSRSPDIKKTELYDYGTDVWTTEADYPFGNGEDVSVYDMLYIEELPAYCVIGGNSGWYGILATIAKFANGVWSSAGDLNSARLVSFCSFCFFLNY